MLRTLSRSIGLAPRFACSRGLVTLSNDLIQNLKNHKIIPDVLNSFNPLGLITISHGNKDVTMGNTLTPAEARQRPLVHTALNISDDPSRVASSYTLVLADPDSTAGAGISDTDGKPGAPCDFVHYIVSGLRLPSDHADFSQLDLDKGSEILPYLGPNLPSKSGKHRFIYILFKEPSTSTVRPSSSNNSSNNGSNLREDNTENALATCDSSERVAFGAGLRVKQWALKHSLIPVAVNFYYAQGDSQ